MLRGDDEGRFRFRFLGDRDKLTDAQLGTNGNIAGEILMRAGHDAHHHSKIAVGSHVIPIEGSVGSEHSLVDGIISAAIDAGTALSRGHGAVIHGRAELVLIVDNKCWT